MHPTLYSIPVRLLSHSTEFLEPTEWDLAVVWDDLMDWVQRVKYIAATPEVAVHDGKISIVSGWPFVQAARNAKDSISEIVCATNDSRIESFKDVAKSDLAQLLQQSISTEEHHGLYLAAPSSSPNVEVALEALSLELKSIVGAYCKIELISVNDVSSLIHWRCQALSPFDKRSMRLNTLIAELSKSTPFSSRNGMKLVWSYGAKSQPIL